MKHSFVRFVTPVLFIAGTLLATNRPAHLTAATLPPFKIGAVFPLHGVMSPLASEEYRGVKIALAMARAQGTFGGRAVQLIPQELDDPAQVPTVMNRLRTQGVRVVIGGYSSDLSIPAAQAAARRGMVYWEAGAVADRLTGRGLPTVFRVGAAGSNLGNNSAQFTVNQLAPRLHRAPAAMRISVVYANDAYASSVAQAAISHSRARGMKVVSVSRFDPYVMNWPPIIHTLRAVHPDVLILASHIPDGVAFRHAFVASHLYVSAFIGSTMAQCVPEFGVLMGKEAVGVFASDRPGYGFNPAGLRTPARHLYRELSRIWKAQTGTAQLDEEALSGFSAAWVLFHSVLPTTLTSTSPTTAALIAAAQHVDLPAGTLPNGAGIRFATDRAHMGQNLRAAAVIWQWQAVRHSVVVWPAVYASGTIRMVPLPR